MAGVRIFCNKIVPVSDWNHEYVIMPSDLITRSPLPALASFDLLNPLDNSGHGFKVDSGGGKVHDWGLHFENGVAPAVTDLKKAGVGAISFVVAFRFSDISRFMHILSNRISGAGFRFFYNAGFYLGITYPSGASTSLSAGGFIPAVKDKWYVAAGVFDPVRKSAAVQIRDAGVQYGDIGTAFPANTALDHALYIGGDTTANPSQTMIGDIAFVAVYEGAFSTQQRDDMVGIGMVILKERGLV